MASIEAILSIGSNKEYLDGLVEQVRRGPGVTPFVGAGMSAQLDLLEWGEFLLATARRFFAEPEVRALLDAGKYEEAAEVCIGRSGPGGLQYSIGEEFGDQKFRAKRISAALRLIPDLVNGPVLTTNFDHVIERAFKEARKDFEQVVWGREADVMIDAFHQNRRYLFKIHGDVDRPKERILTREEYDKHYGQPGRTDGRGLALHRVIDLALSNRPLVFLGCSLKSDRIVGFLDDFYKQNERLTHYAILWRPVDDEQFRARGTALTRLGLKPIWYPYGDHDSIATILEHVLIRAGRRKAPRRTTVAVPIGPTAAQEALAKQKHDELSALGAAGLPAKRFQADALAIAKGELTFFLGWGAHYPRLDRADAPPFWRDVARELAEQVKYDEAVDSISDFARLSQYVFEERGPLFEDFMRDKLGQEYAPTLAHWFLGGLPALLLAKNYTGVAPVILTANQDDVLERAFAELGEPLSVLSYIARGDDGGRFFYRPAAGAPSIIRTAKQAAQVTVNERPLLVKLHGTIDRGNPEAEQMVLTEDDYLSYLARINVSKLPPALEQHLVKSAILFIGYALRDWTIRVLLKQIWSRQRPRKISCAILMNASKVSRTLLDKQGVEVIDQSWEHILAGLVNALRALPQGAPHA